MIIIYPFSVFENWLVMFYFKYNGVILDQYIHCSIVYWLATLRNDDSCPRRNRTYDPGSYDTTLPALSPDSRCMCSIRYWYISQSGSWECQFSLFLLLVGSHCHRTHRSFLWSRPWNVAIIFYWGEHLASPLSTFLHLAKRSTERYSRGLQIRW